MTALIDMNPFQRLEALHQNIVLSKTQRNV